MGEYGSGGTDIVHVDKIMDVRLRNDRRTVQFKEVFLQMVEQRGSSKEVGRGNVRENILLRNKCDRRETGKLGDPRHSRWAHDHHFL